MNMQQDTTPADGQGGDDARPQETTQQQPMETSAAEGHALSHDDPEAAELAAARAAVEAEERAAAAPKEQQDQQQPAANAAPVPPQQQQPQRPGPVPYERFQQAAHRLRTLEEENAFLKGSLDVLREGRQTGAPPAATAVPAANEPAAPAPDSPEAIIAAAEQRAVAAAQKFDVGEITAEELTRVQTAAAKEIATAQVHAALRQNAPAAQTSVTDQVLMEQHVQQLEASYPVLKALNQQQMAFLQRTAEAEAAAAGQPYRAGPRDTMRLREHVARLANVFSQHWGMQPQPATAAGNGASNPTQNPARPSGLTPAAQQRLAKMDMAAGLPPDTARMGQASGTDEISEQQILAMSDDDLAALPAATRARLLST